MRPDHTTKRTSIKPASSHHLRATGLVRRHSQHATKHSGSHDRKRDKEIRVPFPPNASKLCSPYLHVHAH